MTEASGQLRKLAEGLYRATIASRIEWVMVDDELCEAKLGDGYVQTLGEVDDDGDYYYLLRITNEKKQIIDTITGGMLTGGNLALPSTGHSNYWALLTDLHTSARRNAVGAQRVIDSMLQELPEPPASNVSDIDGDIPF